MQTLPSSCCEKHLAGAICIRASQNTQAGVYMAINIIIGLSACKWLSTMSPIGRKWNDYQFLQPVTSWKCNKIQLKRRIRTIRKRKVKVLASQGNLFAVRFTSSGLKFLIFLFRVVQLKNEKDCKLQWMSLKIELKLVNMCKVFSLIHSKH